MRRLLRTQVLKNFVLTAASAAFVPVLLLIAAARVLKNALLFRSAELVVVAPHTAYGHTITAPDVVRRLYPKKASIFVLFADYRLHNSKLSLLWENPRFICLPLSVEIMPRLSGFRLPCISAHKQFLHRSVMSLIRKLVRSGVEIVPRLEELYPRVKIPTLDIDRNRLIINYVWTIGYFELIKQVAAPALKLPERLRRSFKARLDELASTANGAKSPKRCVLYLRQKKEHSTDYHNLRRCGSPLSDYLPAVRFLNAAGYQVLITGDVVLPEDVFREFQGMCTDARSTRLDDQLFNLYAATESDIFVGDPGGGVWLPGLNDVPRLLVNAFPYFFGLPNSWVYYKTLRDSHGQLVHYDRLFSEFAHDYDLAGYTLENNSATEILRAVETFLHDLANPGNPDPGRDILKRVPDFIWAKHAGTRICRTWLDLFQHQMDHNAAPQVEVR